MDVVMLASLWQQSKHKVWDAWSITELGSSYLSFVLCWCLAPSSWVWGVSWLLEMPDEWQCNKWKHRAAACLSTKESPYAHVWSYQQEILMLRNATVVDSQASWYSQILLPPTFHPWVHFSGWLLWQVNGELCMLSVKQLHRQNPALRKNSNRYL